MERPAAKPAALSTGGVLMTGGLQQGSHSAAGPRSHGQKLVLEDRTRACQNARF